MITSGWALHPPLIGRHMYIPAGKAQYSDSELNNRINERVAKEESKERRRKELDKKNNLSNGIEMELLSLAMKGELDLDSLPNIDNIEDTITLNTSELLVLSHFIGKYLQIHLNELGEKLGEKMEDSSASKKDKVDIIQNSLLLADATDKIMDAANNVANKGLEIIEKFIEGQKNE